MTETRVLWTPRSEFVRDFLLFGPTCFGPCFPDREHIMQFLAWVQNENYLGVFGQIVDKGVITTTRVG